MATVSAIENLITNVLAAFKSSSLLAGIQIYDGPDINIDSYPGSYIAVGHDGNETGDVIASESKNNWELVGNYKMFEDGTLNCMLVAQSGDTNMSTNRANAQTLLSAVDTIIRSDPSFSGAVLYSGLDSHRIRQMQTNAGSAVVIDFTILYRARI